MELKRDSSKKNTIGNIICHQDHGKCLQKDVLATWERCELSLSFLANNAKRETWHLYLAGNAGERLLTLPRILCLSFIRVTSSDGVPVSVESM